MFMERIIGVLKLDVATFESIEHDRNATSQAAIVVTIVALLSALGSGIGNQLTGAGFLSGFISGLVMTFIGWIVWSVISYFVGTSLFGGQATIDEMLRVIGFAFAPQFLAIIPCIGGIVGAVWSLIAGFIAIRQGLDLDNTKALLTVLVGFFVYIVGYITIGILIGGASALLS